MLWDAVSAESGGGAVSVDDFLASPGKYTSKAPYDRLKPNPQLYGVLFSFSFLLLHALGAFLFLTTHHPYTAPSRVICTMTMLIGR